MGVLDEDLAVNAQETALSCAETHRLTVSSEGVMVIGFGWAAVSWYLWSFESYAPAFWWLIGGVMLFFMGAKTLPETATND